MLLLRLAWPLLRLRCTTTTTRISTTLDTSTEEAEMMNDDYEDHLNQCYNEYLNDPNRLYALRQDKRRELDLRLRLVEIKVVNTGKTGSSR
jgi:hypothetical protein